VDGGGGLMPLTIGALTQMVEQNYQTNEDAHKRLRGDLREAESRIHDLETHLRTMESRVAALAAAGPPDVTTLRFPLSLVIGVAAGFITIGGGIVKSQVDLSNLRTAQAEFRQDVVNRLDANSKDSANSIQNLKETIIRLDQQQRLQYAEFQTFRQEMARRK
jgi:hypothetical protein